MDTELLVILALAFGIVGLIFLVIAIISRCHACGSLGHGFKSDKVWDPETGHAYIVCRTCGDKQLKGQVSADGSVISCISGTPSDAAYAEREGKSRLDPVKYTKCTMPPRCPATRLDARALA